MLQQIDDECPSHVSPPMSLLILNTLEQRHGVNTNNESHHDEDLIGFHSFLRINSLLGEGFSTERPPKIKEHKCVASAYFLTPPISVIVISVQTFILLHINFKKEVSVYVRFLYVQCNYISSALICKKKQERGPISIKVYGYIIFQFSSHPHFFLVIVNQVPSVLSFLYVCCLLHDMFQ